MITLRLAGRYTIPIFGFLQLSLLASGCVSSGESRRQLADTSELVQRLESEGIPLFTSGIPSDAIFSVDGQVYDIGFGGTLQIYEYQREDEASRDARRSSGGIASSARVFQMGTLLAVYFGDNVTVRRALSGLLGPQRY